MDYAIKTEKLTKDFGALRAVDGLDLAIQPGELYGLVGPDGAGKTTILRMLTSIMDPTSGEAWVAGHSTRKEGERIKEKIGYMAQKFGLYEDLTVMENIKFYADLYEVPMKHRAERYEKLLGFSNLTPFKTRLAGNLSGGMKQKLGLACALIHTPQVLFLDEPTNGVDPVSRRDFWRILYELLKEGITVMVSTAYLDEAERCTRVGLIHKGKYLEENSPDVIKRSLAFPMLEITTEETRKAMDILEHHAGILNVSLYGERLHVALKPETEGTQLLKELHSKGITIISSRSILPSLEDIFITRVKGAK
jgi:ABC-2 type transport system ATP-binding protein